MDYVVMMMILHHGGASMVWTVFAYVCFYDASLGELSLKN
jgi:hypothetical protein